MHLLEIKAMTYPQNLFADLGITDADKVDISVFESVLAEVMQAKQRNLDILHSLYRGSATYSDLAIRYGVTRERIRQIRGQIIKFLQQPYNMLRLQACITKQPSKLDGQQLWAQALAKHEQHITAEQVPAIMHYLKTVGVVFPAGRLGKELTGLITPCIAETLLTLENVHVTALISVWNLDIDPTITRCLLRSSIRTLRDLLLMSGRTLLYTRGLSARRIEVIAARLEELGIAAGHLRDSMNKVSPYTGALLEEYGATFTCLTRNTEYDC